MEAAKEVAANVGTSAWVGTEKDANAVQLKVAMLGLGKEHVKMLEEQDGTAGQVAEKERAVLQGHLAAARDLRERVQAEAACEEGARGETESESEARLQLAGAASSGVVEALEKVLDSWRSVLVRSRSAYSVCSAPLQR